MPFAPVDGGQCRQGNTANSWPCDCPSVTFGIIFASVSIGASRLCDRKRAGHIMVDDTMIANCCRVSQLLCCFKRGSTIMTGSQSACCRTRTHAQRAHCTEPKKKTEKSKPATSQPPTWLKTRPRCTSLEGANAEPKIRLASPKHDKTKTFSTKQCREHCLQDEPLGNNSERFRCNQDCKCATT